LMLASGAGFAGSGVVVVSLGSAGTTTFFGVRVCFGLGFSAGGVCWIVGAGCWTGGGTGCGCGKSIFRRSMVGGIDGGGVGFLL
jgi:hypothetical protein